MAKVSEVKPGLKLTETPIGSERQLTFSNNLRDRMFRCSYGFKGGSVIALGETTEKDGKHILQIYPGETKDFVRGNWKSLSKSHGCGEPDKAWKEKQATDAKADTEKDIKFVKDILQEKGLSKGVTSGMVAEICAEAGIMFVDITFPPRDATIKPAGSAKNVPIFPWKRPSTYLKGTGMQPTLFVDKIEPNDIDQGALADCYLMGALASVAEFEHLVRNMFEAGQDPDLGCYRIALCKNGWWLTVTVDDFLPCSGPKPAYSRNREEPNEIWVSLVEKAYAKVHGSYAAIATGSCARALSDLTGCPSKILEINTDMWPELLKNDQTDFLQVLGTPGKNLMGVPEDKQTAADKALWDKYQTVGLITEHSYSLITVKLTKDGHKLCMIRNPWGNDKEWKGKWSDSDSSSWTPALKKECGFLAQDDGSFWMQWSDVLKWFNTVAVCYTHGTWDNVHVAGNFQKGTADLGVSLKLKKTQKCWIGVHQKDPRGCPPDHPDATLQMVDLWIIGLSESTPKVLGRRSTSQREMYIELTLEPSKGYSEFIVLAQPRESSVTKSMVYSIILEEHRNFEVTFLSNSDRNNLPRYRKAEEFKRSDWKTSKANYQIKGQHSTNGAVLQLTGSIATFKDAKKNVTETELQKAAVSAKQNEKRKVTKSPAKGAVAPVKSGSIKIKLSLSCGKDLVSMDSNGLSDPFCEIKLRAIKNGKVTPSHPNPQKQVSKIIWESLNPIWNEEFTFLVPVSDCIRVSIFDKDIVGKDNMGKVDLQIPELVSTLNEGALFKSKYPVTPTKRGDKVSGYLEIGLQLIS